MQVYSWLTTDGWGFWAGVRGFTGAVVYKVVPAESIMSITRLSLVTVKAVNAELGDLGGQVAPAGQSPSQYANLIPPFGSDPAFLLL